MTKKKFDFTEEPILEEISEPVLEVQEALPPLFDKVMWKNVKEVYKCLKCDTFRNMEEKDEFILHILTHFQDNEEKEAVLDRLLKEL